MGTDANKSDGCFSRLFSCCAPAPNQNNSGTNNANDKGISSPTLNTNNNNGPPPRPLPSSVPMNQSNGVYNNNNTNNQNTNSGGIASLVTQVSQNGPAVPPPLPTSSLIHQSRGPVPNKYLLPPLPPAEAHKKCLVLDLDETLVHSSFKPIPDADFVMTIELENVMHRVYVRKRPGVDHFMKVVGEKFEVIIFTASLAKYADPLLDILDKHKVIKGRLFREACVQHYGNYVKDLTHLGRALAHTMIIDNSPFSYMFQPDNAIPISSWFHEKADRQLYELLPFLDELAMVDDVCTVLQRKRFQFAQQ